MFGMDDHYLKVSFHILFKKNKICLGQQFIKWALFILCINWTIFMFDKKKKKIESLILLTNTNFIE